MRLIIFLFSIGWFQNVSKKNEPKYLFLILILKASHSIECYFQKLLGQGYVHDDVRTNRNEFYLFFLANTCLIIKKSSDLKGVEYTGQVSVTKAHSKYGVRRCRPWKEMSNRKMPTDGGDHNYCRNPEGVQHAPFCWIAKGQPGPKIGFCDIPECVRISLSVTYENVDFSEMRKKNSRTLLKCRQKFRESRHFENWVQSCRFSKCRLLIRPILSKCRRLSN